jgi:hypothetical protein
MSAWLRPYLRLLRVDPTAWALIFANLYAVADCLWHGRPLASLMLAYWVEVGVIGLLAIPKLILIGGRTMAAVMPAYVIPFGIWWLTGLPLMAVINNLEGHSGQKLSSSEGWAAVAGPSLAFGATHIWSFFHNYLGRGEYRASHPRDVLVEVFERMAPTLIATFAGVALGLAAMHFGMGVLAVAPFFLGRVFVDLPAHWHGHGYLEGIEFPWLRWLHERWRGPRRQRV